MTKTKVKLVRIVNDSARKASLKKRKAGLVKKVKELTILCGINAFLVICSDDDTVATTFPSLPAVRQLLHRFNELPEVERTKKMTDQVSYLEGRIKKVEEQTKKQQKNNKMKEASRLLREIYLNNRKSLDDCNLMELRKLAWFAEENKREIRRKMEHCEQNHPLPREASLSSSYHLPGPADGTAQDGEGRSPAELVVIDQLLVDMMNNSEHIGGSSGNSTVRLTTDPGPELTTNQLALTQMWFHENHGPCINSDMALPYENFTIRGCDSSGPDFGPGQLLDQNRSLGGNIDPNINLGLQYSNPGWSSNAVSTMGLTMADYLGGGGGGGGGSDVGQPYAAINKHRPSQSPLLNLYHEYM